MPQIEIPVFLDSAGEGATVTGDGKNILTVNFSTPIIIDHLRKAHWVTCEAQMWNESPNVSAKLGNNVCSFTYGSTYTLIIPDGLYSMSDLQTIIGDFMLNNGLGEQTILLTPFFATGYAGVSLKSGGITVHATVQNSMFGPNLLGFTADFTSTTADQTFTSQLKSDFNKVDSVLFHLSIINGSVYNSNYSDVALRMIVDQPAGYQINKVVQLPMKSQISQRVIDTIILRITDQRGRDLLLNEPFSLTGYILIDE